MIRQIIQKERFGPRCRATLAAPSVSANRRMGRACGNLGKRNTCKRIQIRWRFGARYGLTGYSCFLSGVSEGISLLMPHRKPLVLYLGARVPGSGNGTDQYRKRSASSCQIHRSPERNRIWIRLYQSFFAIFWTRSHSPPLPQKNVKCKNQSAKLCYPLGQHFGF